MSNLRVAVQRFGKLLGVTTLVLAAGFFANAAPVSWAATGEVIIVSDSVVGGLSSREATATILAGRSPVLKTAAELSAMSAAEVAGYDAVVLGDPTCVGPGLPGWWAGLAASATIWGPVVTGNVLINGTDPVYHSGEPTPRPGAPVLINRGIEFALAEAGKTGAYISLSCYYHDFTEPFEVVAEPLLDNAFAGGTAGSFKVRGANEFNDVHIVSPAHPVMSGLTDVLLSDWDYSVHEAFTEWPRATFEVLAIAKDLGSAYAAPDGSVGTPFILARGESVPDPCADLNGGFERGAPGLADCWTLSTILDGISRVEVEGSCFGANNTLGITLPDRRSLNVRSSPTATADSVGIATSDPFKFGASLSFKALTENDDAIPAPDPVLSEWRLLDSAGTTELATGVFAANILTTSPGTTNDGCLVGDARDGAFSSHSIDTSALAGAMGRLEFRQHTKVAGKGFFTLVDEVKVVAPTPSARQRTIPSTGPRVGPNPNR